MRKEPLPTDGHFDLDLEQLIPEATWEKHLLRKTLDAELPNVLDSLSGRSFEVYTDYDANGWFTLDLHDSPPAGRDTSRTGDYSGLCCVVVTPPKSVTVYFILETRTGDWMAHLTSHARPDPEPRR